jgi:hypothetical protein
MNASEMSSLQSAEQSSQRWAERNQRWLVARIAQLCRRLEAPGEAEAPHEASDEPQDFTPALHRLTSLFGLSSFEADVLLLAAGIELDQGLRRAVAALQGVHPQAARASFSLAFATLAGPHWDAMSPSAPLRHWRLLSVEPAATLSEAGLRIDERVLHELTGVAAADERLLGLLQPVAGDAAELDDALARRLVAALDGEPARPALIVLSGDAAAPAAIAATLERHGLRLLALRAHDLSTDARELADCARLIDREAALASAVPLVQLATMGDHTSDHELRAASLAALLRSPMLLLGQPSREMLAGLPQRRVHRLRLPAAPPSAHDGPAPALQRALQQFHLPQALLDTALAGVPSLHDEDAVWQALRDAARGGLDALAQRIVSRTGFDDLVLPAAQLAALRDITRQLRHRDLVYRQWGFAEASSRGLGLCALFAGESGTGKTLAAEAIANEAKLDLFRIDLATVVSKYIGETEKNLKRVFDAAEASGAVLLFDEADALFGKRSEVKDSHDRYANIEIAYLLQRIEAYRGLAILTTNMKSALDRAFLRRIRFVVQFPFPDARAREELWRRQFPEAAPVDGIDCAALAKLQLAGGHIRSIAINAAFKAADAGRPIGHALVVDAARSELSKLERSFHEAAGGSSP